MKKSIQFIALLATSILVIAFAIESGLHHDHCRECPISFGSPQP